MRIVRRLVRNPWPPELAGILLGVVVAVSLAGFGHRLSGAGAYQHLSGYVGQRIAPQSMYWREIVPTGLTWDVLVLIGGMLGAFAASAASRELRIRTMPDRMWQEAFGPSVARRWVVAFAGAMLTEIGGGIAGGCTASLAVSGGAVLSPAAFLFMVAMFATGIPTALVVHRRAEK